MTQPNSTALLFRQKRRADSTVTRGRKEVEIAPAGSHHSSGAMLNDPSLNVASSPNASLCEFGCRLRESIEPRQLVRSLLRHAKHLADLCRSDKFHAAEITS